MWRGWEEVRFGVAGVLDVGQVGKRVGDELLGIARYVYVARSRLMSLVSSSQVVRCNE